MNIIDIVLTLIGITIILFVVVVCALLSIEIAEMLGYKIPNWIKKLKK